MELWIRSQNKHTLIKCNYITTLEKNMYGNIEYTIINEDELELGKYDSEKRLLEVLDEIQKKINLINLGHDFGSPMIDLENPTYIYLMPKGVIYE